VVALRDGEVVRLRPIRPADQQGLTALYARLSPESAYQRFHAVMRRLPPDWARILASVDDGRRMAIVAVGPDGGLVAVARYAAPEADDETEIAVVVEDRWQGRGLGRLLLTELLRYGAARGLGRFRAYVLADRSRVRRLIADLGRVIERKLADGVVSVLFAPRLPPGTGP
jgi:GNAT superfamily N-acetyltransferase